MRMFFRMIIVAALSATTVPPTMADEASDNLTATRLAIACPEAEHVQVRDDHITWRSEDRDVAKARRCLKEAYRAVVADPFPVNMRGLCHATKVSVRKGKKDKIVLSC